MFYTVVKFTQVGVNLLRGENGVYYARIVHLGRQHWKTLKTKVSTVAKQRLRIQEDLIRGRKVTKGLAMTFGQAAEIYAEEVMSNPRLAAGTKEFRLRPAATFKRTWPRLEGTDIRRVTEADCLGWQKDFENGKKLYWKNAETKHSIVGNSPTVVNACIGYLRRVFDIAVKEGLIGENPSLKMKRMPPTVKDLIVPTSEQLQQMIAHVRRSHSRWAIAAAELIEGMAYSGMRLKEAGELKWSDIDPVKNLMHIAGSKTKASNRWVPPIPQMVELLSRIERTGPYVFTAKSASASLKKACVAVGVQEMTHHDLRHYFATAVIESGVDIPTLSKWLGHSDGGYLCMKTYGHIRSLHSAKAAATVKV